MRLQGYSFLLAVTYACPVVDRQIATLDTLVAKGKWMVPSLRRQINYIDANMSALSTMINYGAIDISQPCRPFGFVEQSLQNMTLSVEVCKELKCNLLSVLPNAIYNMTMFSKIQDVIRGNSLKMEKRFNISGLLPSFKPLLKGGLFDDTSDYYNRTKLNLLINIFELWNDLEAAFVDKSNIIAKVANLTKCPSKLYNFTTFDDYLNRPKYYEVEHMRGPIRRYQSRSPAGFYWKNGTVATNWSVMKQLLTIDGVTANFTTFNPKTFSAY